MMILQLIADSTQFLAISKGIIDATTVTTIPLRQGAQKTNTLTWILHVSADFVIETSSARQ